MIALQGDDNKCWTRPVGIIATALVTGIASLTASLHVPHNVDKLIDIRRQFTVLVNNFEYDVQGKPTEEAERIRKKYADDFSMLSSERLKLKGIGRALEHRGAARAAAPGRKPKIACHG